MTKVKQHTPLLRAAVATIVLLVFLMSTNPNKVALGLLVLPILLISFIIYESVSYVLSFYRPAARRRRQAISLIVALTTGLLLMLQSIGQLAAGDVASIVFLLVLSVFYVSRFR